LLPIPLPLEEIPTNQPPAADQLIATLKAELAAQKETSKETLRLQKQLDTSESKADTLQTKLTALTTSLAESKSEIKSLNLKLSAARSAEAAATVKVPGSAMKGSTVASRLAAANASEATLAAQKKENLYGDLTGLIVRSVKRVGAEDMFDCIQTGRNGSKPPPPPPSQTPSSPERN
jgi:chromosome segregation ATPase